MTEGPRNLHTTDQRVGVLSLLVVLQRYVAEVMFELPRAFGSKVLYNCPRRGVILKQANNLKLTNIIIYVFSLIGSVVLILNSRQCVEECEYKTLGVYVIDTGLIAFGVAGILLSTLTYQVINLFIAHVEMSHKSQ